MTSARAPERPVLRYFGGKWMLAPWIIQYFPTHQTYVEPFGGGGSVLLRKDRAHLEVYNDLDDEIVAVFRVLREPELARELERQMRLTPFARAEFNTAYGATDDPVERARRALFRALAGHGARGIDRGQKTGFRAAASDIGVPPSVDWTHYPDHIATFTSRLSGVVIENRPALEVIQQQDRPDTLFFVDPPYVAATRGAKSVYRHEMTDDQHVELRDFLLEVKGMVILCGYENDIYGDMGIGWTKRAREAHADGGRDRVEILWLNPAADRAQAQARFL